MRAIVQSIHSQVPETIASLGERLDGVVSLDSHLDVSLGGDYGVYPEELRVIAQRTGAHTGMLEVLGWSPAPDGTRSRRRTRGEMIVAMPHSMLSSHASDIEENLPSALRLSDHGASMSSVAEFLEKTLGIEVYQSPPKALTGLTARVRNPGRWLLDVDVDYMTEMQDECYTQIKNTARGVLQSMQSVVRFIDAWRPETITISEARVSAMRDGESRFSEFMASLVKIGYTTETRGIFQTDLQVLSGISVCKEFYETVSKPLMRKHMGKMMRGEMGEFEAEEKATAKKFFLGRGYTL